MKFLVLLAVVLTVLWLARHSRTGSSRGGAAPGAAPRGAPAAPQAMVACPACGVHLPRSEALPGPGGQFYCCEEHRARGGG